MKRGVTVLCALVAAAALLVAGCSKDKNQQAEVTRLQTQVKDLETQLQTARGDLDKAALKAADERRQQEDAIAAYQLRLMHQPLDKWDVQPDPRTENSWFLIDAESTFQLKGYPTAKSVKFYWAAFDDRTPHLLFTDTDGKDGWKYKGTLPSGTMKAFWAEVELANGTTEKSPVIPIRGGGK